MLLVIFPDVARAYQQLGAAALSDENQWLQLIIEKLQEDTQLMGMTRSDVTKDLPMLVQHEWPTLVRLSPEPFEFSPRKKIRDVIRSDFAAFFAPPAGAAPPPLPVAQEGDEGAQKSAAMARQAQADNGPDAVVLETDANGAVVGASPASTTEDDRFRGWPGFGWETVSSQETRDLFKEARYLPRSHESVLALRGRPLHKVHSLVLSARAMQAAGGRAYAPLACEWNGEESVALCTSSAPSAEVFIGGHNEITKRSDEKQPTINNYETTTTSGLMSMMSQALADHSGFAAVAQRSLQIDRIPHEWFGEQRRFESLFPAPEAPAAPPLERLHFLAGQIERRFVLDALFGCAEFIWRVPRENTTGVFLADPSSCLIRAPDGLIREPEHGRHPYDPRIVSAPGDRFDTIPWELWDLKTKISPPEEEQESPSVGEHLLEEQLPLLDSLSIYQSIVAALFRTGRLSGEIVAHRISQIYEQRAQFLDELSLMLPSLGVLMW